METSLRILIVEDSLDDAELLLRAVRRGGYEIEAQRVETADAMQTALASQAWDLIISDHSMPQFNSVQALELLKNSGRDIPFIIVSGSIGEDAAVAALKAGAHDFMTKGNLARLIPAVQRELREAEIRRERKRAEERLQLSDQILQRVHALVLVTDTRGNIVYVSPAAKTILGYEPDELLGDGWWRLSHSNPIEAQREKEYVERAARGEIPIITDAYERSVQDRLGATHWIEWVDAPGPGGLLIGVGHDVTERKQAEEQLRESEEKFRQIAETIGEVFWVADPEISRMLYISPAYERVWNRTTQSLHDHPQSFIEAIHPEDRERVLTTLLVRIIGIPFNHEYRINRPDGSICWIWDRGFPVLDENGTVLRYVGVAMDITERKQAEEALRQSDERFRSLFENMPISIWEEDFSAVKAYLDDLKSEGVSDLETYLDDHPQEVSNCVALVKIIDVNQASLKLHKAKTKAELLKGLETTFTAEAFGAFKRELITIARDERRMEMDEIVLTLDGDQRDVSLGWAVAPGYETTYSRVLVSLVDITERKQAEAALREAEAKYRTLVEQIPAIMYITALDEFSRASYVSPQISTLGFTPEEWITGLWVKQLHPEDRERVLAEVQRSQAALEPFSSEYRLLTRDGRVRWYRDEAVIVRDGQGEPRFLQGIMLDITERQRATDKIQRQLQKLKALHTIDMAISTSFDINLSLTVLLNQTIMQLGVSAAAILLHNPNTLTLEYVVGKGFTSSAIEQTRLRIGEGLAGRVALERRKTPVVNLVESADRYARGELLKEEAFVSYYATPLIAKGELKGVLEVFDRAELEANQEWLDFVETLAGQAAIAIDNSNLFINLQTANAMLEQRVAERTAELARTNVELEHVSRAKDEFLANMSHELRTPLNSILGFSETLLEQRRGPLNDYQQKSLQIIESSGRHLLELINDILDLSKIEAGVFELNPQPVLVDEICASSLSFIKAQAAKKSITVTYANESSVSQIFADIRRLKQILVNLLTNAVKFTPEHGDVKLLVETDPEEQAFIQFSVIDSGIGIAAEDLRKIFQPFVQADGSLNRQQEGTGLGLALVQRLTDLHGGSVHVESEVAKGSRFTIKLACRLVEDTDLEKDASHPSPPIDQQAEITGPPMQMAGPRGVILLAEDNLPNILTIGEYLESHEYEIVVAHNGEEAIARAEEINPDVILMDIQMPVMDGLEAMRRLRANPPFASTPIIALTALAMPGDRERCLEAGATEYMSKPVSLKMLVKTIRKLLAQEE